MPKSSFLMGKKHTITKSENKQKITYAFSAEDIDSDLSQTNLKIRVLNFLNVLPTHVDTDH